MKTKLLCLMLAISSFVMAQTYENTTEILIPDGTSGTSGCGSGANPGSDFSLINVPISGTIIDPTEVTINLQLTHTWCGDFVIELVLPSGERCGLIKRLGSTTDTSCGDSSDFISGNVLSFKAGNTDLIDTATPGAADPVLAGDYAPTGGDSDFPFDVTLCDLSSFLLNAEINGDWSLVATDYGNGDLGSIFAWQIVFDDGSILSSQDNLISGSPIRVMENPISENLTLSLHKNGINNVEINVYSLDGKQVYNQNYPMQSNNEIVIDAKNWSSGLYLVVPIVDGVKQKVINIMKK